MDALSRHQRTMLIRKLESICHLLDDERTALESLPMRVKGTTAKETILHEGDKPTQCRLLLEGYAATYKVNGEGKRQITAFHMPGDVPDLQGLQLKALDSGLCTLTPCVIGLIEHEVLRDLCRRYPKLNDAFWRETLVDAAIAREWVTNIGSRNCTRRIAHVLCEWLVRMRAVGLVWDLSCELPVTQAELGDAMGITSVHVNRVIMDLRAQGLIALSGRTLMVLDWEQLNQVGDFDPTYLHLNDPDPVVT